MFLNADLSQAIKQCLIKDRFWLTQQAKKLSEPNAKFVQRFEHSLQQVTVKQQSKPNVSYAQQLPVSERADEIVQLLGKHQVVVVAGETGSGKTTQLPKIALNAGLGIYGRIGHTQPRRLAARSVATRLAQELNVELGKQVGFQVRFNDVSDEHSLIKVMTDGVLLNEIKQDRFLSQYDCLIIDEAHERSLNIDFLLGYLKRLLSRRPDLKLIITSATIDLDRFSKHFNNAPVVEVAGRTFPVSVDYCEHFDGTLPEKILSAYQYILQQEKAGQTHSKGGDVLVFLPGEREIREAALLLKKAKLPALMVLPLYARLNNAEQQHIFRTASQRRLILSTNVAETSLTVPGIHYVIDSGLARISRYSLRSKIQRLPIEPISQASANQRAGRCGRVAPGLCIRLYDEEDFERRSEFTEPEILRTNLASVILQMLHLRLGEVQEFPFIQMPDNRLVRDGYQLLFELQAVDNKQQLTNIGKIISRLPIDPRLARILVAANGQACLGAVSIIVAGLSIQDPREWPQEKQQAARQAHAQDKDPKSDFIVFLNLWKRFEEQRQALSQNHLRKFCKQHFLNYLRMREWRDLHHQLLTAMKDLNWVVNQSSLDADYESLHRAILTGFLSHSANWQEEYRYQGCRNRQCKIHPSTQTKNKKIKWLVAAEMLETSHLFARIVAEIQPQWLLQAASHLTKSSYSQPHWSKKQGAVIASEKVTYLGLIVVAARRVAFDKIDPVLSREILIRQGLVEQQLQTRAKVLLNNQQQIKQVEALEAKARSKDILVDDQWLYDFYAAQLPEGMTNAISLHHWLKQSKNADSLRLTQDMLIKQAEHGVAEYDYPDYLQVASMKLPLKYQFTPTQDDDGVSVTVPQTALAQLDESAIEWLVPGLVRNKAIALIKGLPKQWRRHFVPVPDFVDDFFRQSPDRSQSLTKQLAAHLRFKQGVMLPDDLWQFDRLEAQHRLTLNVVDPKGKTVAKGDNLSQLRGQLSDVLSTDMPATEQSELLDELPVQPIQVSLVQKHAGIEVIRYLGLEFAGGQLKISHFDSEYMFSSG